MSGGNCPETPRQKMIGMMYLFLTAMLAVNVSSNVLNGFTKIDDSLRANNEIFEGNNSKLYSMVAAEHEINPKKYADAFSKSQQIRMHADSLCAVIDSAKWKVARVADGETGNPYNLIAKDNVDAGFEALVFKMIGSKEITPAEQIKADINSFRKFLLDEIVQDTASFQTLAVSISRSLDTSDPVDVIDAEGKKDPHAENNISWEEEMFTGIPVGAVMALMSNMQVDIRNSESMALTFLLSQVTAGEFSVNKIEAHMIPASNYLVRGASFQAKALLAATDSTQKPTYEVYVDGNPISSIDDKGNYSFVCNKTGVFEVTGNIITKDPEGNPRVRKFEPVKYEVADPFATVSATKMNVLYAGVDNPMSISVPGFSSKDIVPRLSDGSPLVPTKNGYIAKPKTPGKDIMVIVNAKLEGKMTQVGQYPFRVKSLPPPTAYIQYPKETTNASGKKITVNENFSTGRLKKKDLIDSYGIVAELPESDFDVTYKVLSFDITFYDNMGNSKTFPSTSGKFTKEQSAKIRGLVPGKSFYISNIKAVGPDGITQSLSMIDVTLN